MPTLVATVGAANANSYVTRAEADTYLEAQLTRAAWDSASNDDKDRALIAATREMETLFYIGYRVNTTQALQWPRIYALDPDRPYDADHTALFFATTEIPQRVKDATCRLALAFLSASGDSLLGLDGNANVRVKTIGPLTTEYDTAARPVGLARVSLVMDLLRPLLDTAAVGNGANIPLVRV